VPDALYIVGREAAVDGGRIATFEMDAAKRGAPVVLAVHGLTANSRSWLAVARHLTDRARFLALDLRGRGDSCAVGEPFGIDSHVADLMTIIEGLELPCVTLVGHSLGAYIASRFAHEHPDRVTGVVLLDGGLRIPGSERVDPQRFVEALLGPTFERLGMRFSSREDYHAWWFAHPAFADGAIATDDIAAFADHDLTGFPPELRSSISEPALRADAADLARVGSPAHELAVPAQLLCAPRGLRNEPAPLLPFDLAESWARDRPGERKAVLVEDCNHYTIAMGDHGARAAAATILELADAARRSSADVRGV
jgi:pimeloyl-ACP methyl ester carboxylesterase